MPDLREAGEVVSVKTVAKLMRRHHIRGISPRPWHPVTTIGDGRVHTIPDLTNTQKDELLIPALVYQVPGYARPRRVSSLRCAPRRTPSCD